MRTLWGTAIVGGCALFAAPAPARAEPQAACSEAYVQGQRLQNRQKLLAAREHFTRCAELCSAAFARECRDWLRELERRIPSVVVRPEDPEGADLQTASVAIDGVAVRSGRDAAPTPLEVGAHRVRVESAGFIPIEQAFDAEEGTAARVLELRMDRAAPVVRDRPVETTAPAKVVAESPTTRPVPWTAYALGGLALVGAAGFTVFAVRGENERSTLDDRQCAPRCPIADVDRMRQSYLFADVSLAVGVVAAAAAIVLYVTRPARIPTTAIRF